MKTVLCFGFVLSFFGAIDCYSQVTVGPNNPTAAADGGGGGGGVPSWSIASGTPYSSDNTYATIVSQLKSKNTNYLHITGFGFALPAGSYIAGIKVEVEMYGTVAAGATNRENSVFLINSSGSRVGTDHSTAATLATADPNSYVTYGSTSDTWGGVLTYADINSASFGVALQYQSGSINNTAGNYNFNVDHVRITVNYTPGFDAVANGCFNDGATWGRVSPGTAGVDYPNATIAANIPGGRTVTVCSGTTANCFALNTSSDLSASSAAVLTLADATSTLNVAGNITMQSTTASTASFAAGTINLTGGTITAQGNLIMTADRNAPNATSQSIVFGGGTLTVNGDVTMSADNAAAATTLNMNAANSTLNLGGDLGLGVGASLTNGSGATGTINYKGSISQIVRSVITYFNLTYSGGGLKTLDGATSANGMLTMTSGNSDLAGLTLTLGSSGTTALKGTLSYTAGTLYNGTFKRFFDNSVAVSEGAAAGLFPVGSPNDYRPFSVYFTAAPSAGGSLSVIHDYSTTGVTTVAITDGGSTIVRRTNMFWTLTAANSFNIASPNLNARIEGTNIGQIGLVSDLRITRSATVIGTAGANAGTTSNPIVRRTSLPAFTASSNTFYIGSVDAVSSPLPIELIEFKAKVVMDAVQLTWKTASELNNDFFTVERSATAEDFVDIGKVNGKGTTSEAHTYTLEDSSPLSGAAYYRLKQTDINGKFTYSKIVSVVYEGVVSPRMVVYPNPSRGSEMSIEIKGLKNAEMVPLIIYDQLGRTYVSQMLMVDENSDSVKKQITFESALPVGVYVLKVGSSRPLVSRFIVIKE